MKAAWRADTWWADPDMRLKYITTIGGVLCILGMFAIFFILFEPASVKLMLGAALLYALVRLTCGFWQARSSSDQAKS